MWVKGDVAQIYYFSLIADSPEYLEVSAKACLPSILTSKPFRNRFNKSSDLFFGPRQE